MNFVSKPLVLAFGLMAFVAAPSLLPVFPAGAAVAQDAGAKAKVDAAKAQGLVGEQSDGFLGYVKDGADPALKLAVSEINAGRAQVYREAAARNKVDVGQAGAQTFSSIIFPKIPAGQYYRTPEGRWVQK